MQLLQPFSILSDILKNIFLVSVMYYIRTLHHSKLIISKVLSTGSMITVINNIFFGWEIFSYQANHPFLPQLSYNNVVTTCNFRVLISEYQAL